MRRAGERACAAIAALACALVAASLAPTDASAEDAPRARVGARLGGTLSALSQPTDPAGEPTLLYGSGFVGPGFSVGAAGAWSLTTTPVGALDLELDVLYTQRSGTGYAEDSTAGERQTVELTSRYVQVPLRLGLRSTGAPLTWRVAAGPQLLIGLFSGATVTYEGIDAPAQPLDTAAPTHVGAQALFGLAYQGDGFSVPLELRFDWDPMVPGSTRGRFEEVDGPTETYSAAFDFGGSLMIGIDLLL